MGYDLIGCAIKNLYACQKHSQQNIRIGKSHTKTLKMEMCSFQKIRIFIDFSIRPN